MVFLRSVAILALASAGVLRSPFSPVAVSDVPAHELFFSALGALQLMLALALTLRPTRAWFYGAILLTGTSLSLAGMARLLGVPFTNVIPQQAVLGLTYVADVIALCALVLQIRPRVSHPRQWLAGGLAILGLGAGLWGLARFAEPYLPDLAHRIVNQFERFDALSALSATDYTWQLPEGFPVPYVPSDNPMSEAKVELGRYLFYDRRLSGNNTMACASCHLQELAFSDGVTLPIGSTGEAHVRNSQTLTNVAYNASFTWGNPVLTEIEQQVVIPLFGEFPVEMGITGHEDIVLQRLRQDTRYQALFAAAYPSAPTEFSFQQVVQALSSFVRTLISGHSAYDRFVYQGDESALSASALRGMDLFLSERFECHHCHGGFNFSLSTRHANTTFPERPFFNTGLYNLDGQGAYPRGNTGIHEITGNPEDMGRFRPPSLRNITLTAPYMHDGSIATLEEVILFYADGGRWIATGEYAGDGRLNPYKSGFVPGFEISEQELADLVAFLQSLTDEQFIQEARFSDPFKSEPSSLP